MAVLKEKPNFSPEFNASRIYCETMRQLESFLSLVREGKSLHEALAFARFVIWSGIVPLCEEYRSGDDCFRCDGRKLQKTAEKLQRNVQDWFSKNDMVPHVPVSEMENISLKLDFLVRRATAANAVELYVVPRDV